MKPLLSIRNPDRWWPRLTELVAEIAKAKKNHKPHADLERSAMRIRAAIIDYENRKAA